MNCDYYRFSISFEDYEVIKGILYQCALAGITLTRIPYVSEDIENVGKVISETCLDGLLRLENGRHIKRPGRKVKDGKET